MSLKKATKNLLSIVLPKAWFWSKDQIYLPILCYHSVNPKYNEECKPLSPELFSNHLEYLNNHYDVVSLRRVLNYLILGSPLPKNPIALTFDDGYRDNFEIVLPLLEKFNCHATFFLVSSFIDGKIDLAGSPGWEGMTWEQVKSLDKSPFGEVAAHTDSHRLLSSLDEVEVLEEILTCQKKLQMNLERDVDLFAYPNGQGSDIPPYAIDVLRQNGFIGACSTFWRTTQKKNEQYRLNRIMITQHDSIRDLEKKLSGQYDFLYFIHKIKAFFYLIVGGRGIF